MTPCASPVLSNPFVYLVALGADGEVDHLLDVACDLGSALGAIELHLVHVLRIVLPVGLSFVALTPDTSSLVPLTEGSQADIMRPGRVLLSRARAHAAQRYAGAIFTHVMVGTPWRAITGLASTIHADLVVAGTAGRTGLARITRGSVAEQVVRHAPCPVLIVRPNENARSELRPAHDAATEPRRRTR